MKKILIIEDDKSIAELERDYLEIEGFSVEIALTGDDGLTKALDEETELVLLDLMLPGMNGFQICKAIRIEKDIPVLMVSAKKEDIDKIRGLGLGADDYIVKPFSPSELVARVKAHLARYDRLIGKEVQNDGIVIRGLRIDKASRRVFVNNHEVIFTAKEFDLLTFLSLHPNHVFKKEELFERLWGFDSLGDISTVTVHIRKIREKMEVDPSNPQYIETVWGAGYRFKE
ncbi:DNA-binding response regulator, OmpR family, contains REC and winged-helix (wHTH) domain [Bacillus sp. OV166]|uniref:response regulator transcription factor n=1 Tax=Bacillus sp. OV166 TaxID=1882763 RepID=UPI000A2ABF11|nr:response regulator transcription factor [Bacillus sp. OV166]SMQ86855.1 DNA-binding response regulator, OmpR family, contains REC and winged-helix (wHTH) domain [Bacillus sp. OV166]